MEQKTTEFDKKEDEDAVWEQFFEITEEIAPEKIISVDLHIRAAALVEPKNKDCDRFMDKYLLGDINSAQIGEAVAYNMEIGRGDLEGMKSRLQSVHVDRAIMYYTLQIPSVGENFPQTFADIADALIVDPGTVEFVRTHVQTYGFCKE